MSENRGEWRSGEGSGRAAGLRNTHIVDPDPRVIVGGVIESVELEEDPKRFSRESHGDEGAGFCPDGAVGLSQCIFRPPCGFSRCAVPEKCLGAILAESVGCQAVPLCVRISPDGIFVGKTEAEPEESLNPVGNGNDRARDGALDCARLARIGGVFGMGETERPRGTEGGGGGEMPQDVIRGVVVFGDFPFLEWGSGVEVGLEEVFQTTGGLSDPGGFTGSVHTGFERARIFPVFAFEVGLTALVGVGTGVSDAGIHRACVAVLTFRVGKTASGDKGVHT